MKINRFTKIYIILSILCLIALYFSKLLPQSQADSFESYFATLIGFLYGVIVGVRYSNPLDKIIKKLLEGGEDNV